MATTAERQAKKRERLLAALDVEDQRLLAALEEEADQPYIPPFRYDVRHRVTGSRP